MDNVIKAILSGGGVFRTAPVYQYNQGMVLEFSGADLPASFVVDFSNSQTGNSIPQTATNNRVTIPDQFFQPGAMIYAWIVLVDESSVVTKYQVMIPVSPRAVRTNDEPTPEQRTALDEAIAALNQGVEDAEAARDAIEDMSVSAASLPADSSATVTKSVDPETGAVSLAFGIPKGEKGDKGDTGAQGPQGIQGIQGETGPQGPEGPAGADGKDGQDGAPGVDGTSSYVWIRYAAAEPTQDSDMKTTPDAWMGIYSGDSATAPTAYTAYTWYNIKGQTGPVSDVQVNGTSVVTDGVANVPLASSSTPGVAKVSTSYGLAMANGIIKINTASITQCKDQTGSTDYQPLTVFNQHAASFYGLAKAAGDATQSASSNAVGNYTESAKSAISQMLNGPVTVSGTTPSITALPGVRYVCGEVSTLNITLPASGDVEVIFESGSTATVLTVTPPSGVTAIKWPGWFDPTDLDADAVYDIIFTNGELAVVTSWT